MQEVNGYTGDCKNDSIPGIFPESVALSWWREEQIRLILYEFIDVHEHLLEEPNKDIKVKTVLKDQEMISFILWIGAQNFRRSATEVMTFLRQRVFA